MAELFGKKTGICRGQGGSMHMFSKKHGLVRAVRASLLSAGTPPVLCPYSTAPSASLHNMVTTSLLVHSFSCPCSFPALSSFPASTTPGVV